MFLWSVFLVFINQAFISTALGANLEEFGDEFSPNNDAGTECERGWNSFGEMCYKLSSEQVGSQLSWEKASEVCKKKFGGNLASIHSNELQDFLTDTFSSTVPDNVWIGLHERINETGYMWDDGSAVDYTNWRPREPSGLSNGMADCVEMVFSPETSGIRVGLWKDTDCKAERMFICQKEKDNIPPIHVIDDEDLGMDTEEVTYQTSSTQNPKTIATAFSPNDAYTNCAKGWYSFGNMCYGLGTSRKGAGVTWFQAAEICRKDFDGNLVTIDSKELQEFLTAYLLLTTRRTVWIGMNDREEESVYTWDDGTPVNYTNWEPEEPSGGFDGEEEDCVEMVFRSGRSEGKTGQWNDIHCNVKRMFICQREKDTSSKKILDPRYCSPSGGWKFEKSCFHVFSERKTWYDAEEFCVEKLGGHLASIPDYRVDLFLNYLLRDQANGIWIGIKTKDDVQQKWSSGWLVGYENWIPFMRFKKDTCSVRDARYWFNLSCKLKLPFICEQSSAKPPSLKPAPEGSFCPKEPPSWQGVQGWRDLGGEYCYYIEMRDYVSWPMANFLCMRRGGSLASIHSPEELDVLKNFVEHKHFAVHIGLHRSLQDAKRFVWTDRSPVDFTNFDVAEPNFLSEICVELRTYNMRWNDINCDAERGYICSVRKISPK